MLAELHVPPVSPDVHEPVQLIFEEHGTPADVCWGCSDVFAGALIPVSQCEVALRRFDENDGPTSFLRMRGNQE